MASPLIRALIEDKFVLVRRYLILLFYLKHLVVSESQRGGATNFKSLL